MPVTGSATQHPRSWPGATSPIRFVPSVALTKDEVFRACQALADAERVVRRIGADDEAAALWALFELLERRIATAAVVGAGDAPVGSGGRGRGRAACL